MIFWGCLVFSRDFRRPKRAKFKIYLILRVARASVVALLACRLACPLVAGVSGSLCYFANVNKIGQDAAGCSAFCPPSSLVFGALLANMALFRNFRRFLAGFLLFRVCLLGLLALGGLCGFCVRE